MRGVQSRPHQVGKHPFMVRGNVRLPIPNPHRRQIGVPLPSRILKRAGVSNKEWLEK